MKALRGGIKKIAQSGHIVSALCICFAAADRDRTGTSITTHGILSPRRLPVPPQRHMNICKIPDRSGIQNEAKTAAKTATVLNDPDRVRTGDLRRDRAAL